MTKTIYFVRHGESEYNVSDTILEHDTDLTERGLKQAEFCAERCGALHFNKIVSSPLVRAQKTAEAIQRVTKKPIEICDYFVEYRYPDSIVGMKKTSGFYGSLIGGTEKNYPGGEVFVDLQSRSGNALKFLEEHDEHSIVVVSHALFLYFLIARMMFGVSLTFREYERVMQTFGLMSNAGITRCTFNPEKPEGKKWKLVTWNDDAHLGEPHIG